MKKAVVVCNADTPLGTELVRAHAKAGYSVLAAIETKEHPAFKDTEHLTVFSWNKLSPVSTRALVLDALHRFERLDRVIYPLGFGGKIPDFHSSNLALVDELVDRELKAFLFFSKECLSEFHKRSSGSFVLAVQSFEPEELSPIHASILGAVRGFAASTSAQYANEPFLLHFFESSEEKNGDFARFVLESLETDPKASAGRWLKFAQKPGLFGNRALAAKRKK